MKTKIFIPDNIYSRLFVTKVSDSVDFEIVQSSLIAKKLAGTDSAIGLIPTLDLLNNKELFVSSKLGLSFNALLSNSFIYYKEGQEEINKLFISGDISSNDLILSKLMFHEFYGVDIELVLSKNLLSFNEESFIRVGDSNYLEDLFLNGLSFTEEVIELINAPYVNFVLAGSNEESLKTFVRANEEKFKSREENLLEHFKNDFSEATLNFFFENIQNLIFDLEEQDMEGIKYLLQMPYYYGLINEMVELKFV